MNAEHIESAAELRELYRELILDHARKPRHFGQLRDATHSANGINPLCGDNLNLDLAVGDGIIRDAAFEATGCAISVASASLMTDTIIGRTDHDALQWSDRVTTSLTSEDDTDAGDLGKLAALMGVRQFPSRIKCATLAWHALRNALRHEKLPASTE
ncbi:MAG: SUF system NifU family Fe-S cluster assembly protein [Woeseiaceae bacterium]|nr:SUF system NifU family Fe-S cluster assembly protein [Woeseiaceae bacterium]